MKLNELGWQKLKRQNFWQQEKHVTLYILPFSRRKQREPFLALDS